MAGEVLIQMGLRARCLVCDIIWDFSNMDAHPEYAAALAELRERLVAHAEVQHRLEEDAARSLVASWVS